MGKEFSLFERDVTIDAGVKPRIAGLTLGYKVERADSAVLAFHRGDGRRVRLDQLATVSDTVTEQRSAALLNGKPVVGFEIVRSRGAGEVEVTKGVRAVLEKLKQDYPDITITEAFNFVDPVQENFEGSMALLIEGAILAVIVVWLFLRDWRATFVSATALPAPPWTVLSSTVTRNLWLPASRMMSSSSSGLTKRMLATVASSSSPAATARRLPAPSGGPRARSRFSTSGACRKTGSPSSGRSASSPTPWAHRSPAPRPAASAPDT